MSDTYVPPYSLVIKWTGEYDPDATNPEIIIEPVPDQPGTYTYIWTTHHSTLNANEMNGKLDEVWNGISTYTFNVYYGSPCWDCFFPARTAVRLWSEKEQKYIFTGRVADVTEHMGADGILYRTVQCENELAYFCDSICDTKDVEDRLAEFNRSMNARDVLITMLELHHYNTGGIAATITKGFFPPNSTFNDSTGAFSYPTNCYPTTAISEAFNGDIDTTWALMQDVLVNSLGMDIWVSYDDSVVPLDGDATWTFGYNVLNMQPASSTGSVGDPITISTNMKSLKIETSPTSNGRITRIVPLGGIGVNGRRLDVSSIPQYHEGWTDPSYEKAISNEFLSITYGHVDKVSLHEDLVDNGNKTESEVNAMIDELYRRGKAEADALTGGITSISIEAADLYEAGVTGAHKFQIGNVHRIVNPFFGLDESFKLVRKVTDLAEPWNPKLEFAKSQTSSTNLTKNRQTQTSGRIYNVENMISSRLDNSAVKRTTQSAYDLMTSRNPTTVHYADQGDGTWKAYMGDEPIVFSDGGWEVENAVLYDAANLHDYTVDTELMVDISANTKLYYGGTGNMIVAQGMLCYFGSRTLSGSDFTDALDTLLTQNSDYISPEYTGITSYYVVNTSHVVFKNEVDIRVYPYEIDVAQTNNQVRWWFRIEATTTRTNMSTSAVTVSTTTAEVNFNTADITDITDYGLILVSNHAGASSPNSYLNGYIPNGYIGSNTSSPSSSAVAAMLVYKNSNQAVNKWNANYAGTISNLTYTSLGAASYMPLSAGETVFAMGATQRSEPVSGGGN